VTVAKEPVSAATTTKHIEYLIEAVEVVAAAHGIRLPDRIRPESRFWCSVTQECVPRLRTLNKALREEVEHLAFD
jgi:hypothetical protein